MSRRVLVAGIGNIFLGDDGFGVEVARRLGAAELPDGVVVADYGISGMHLAYDLMNNGYHTTILVDATTRGEEPGTVTVIELDTSRRSRPNVASPGSPRAIDAHGMQPDAVLELVTMLGGDAGRVLLVGCEPANVADGIGLSPSVAAAVEPAARAVNELVRDELRDEPLSRQGREV